MKNNLLAALLAGLLLVLGLGASFQSLRYLFMLRRVGNMQNQANQYNFRLNLTQALVNESVEYSKRNPAIDPILQQFRFKVTTGTNTTPPAGKPGGK